MYMYMYNNRWCIVITCRNQRLPVAQPFRRVQALQDRLPTLQRHADHGPCILITWGSHWLKHHENHRNTMENHRNTTGKWWFSGI